VLHIKFHPRHIAPIQDKEKRLTIRWDGPEVRSGDGIKFVDADNSQIFGTGIVMDAYDMAVENIINTDWKYHSNYTNLAQFQSEFGVYYDTVFTRDDILDVIEWGDTFTPNHFYGR